MARLAAVVELGTAVLETVLLVVAGVALEALERALATPPRVPMGPSATHPPTMPEVN